MEREKENQCALLEVVGLWENFFLSFIWVYVNIGCAMNNNKRPK